MTAWQNIVPSKDEQREQKRRMLLRVAARIFNKKGFHNTSLDEIAEKLGVTKPTLYYYVSGKDDLLYQCLKVTYDCGRRARGYADQHGNSAIDKIYRLHHRFIVLLLSEHGAYTTSGDIAALPADQQRELLERRKQFDRYNRDLLRSAVEEGSIRQVDVRVASNFLLGAINWILRWYPEDDSRTPEAIADAFLDIFFRGVSAGT